MSGAKLVPYLGLSLAEEDGVTIIREDRSMYAWPPRKLPIAPAQDPREKR